MVYKVERKSDKNLFAAKVTKCIDDEIRNMVCCCFSKLIVLVF